MSFCQHCGRGGPGGWVDYRLIAREFRRSRKARNCEMCERHIAKGETYAHVRHIIENELQNNTICTRCEPERVPE